jgi:hypothetical protein
MALTLPPDVSSTTYYRFREYSYLANRKSGTRSLRIPVKVPKSRLRTDDIATRTRHGSSQLHTSNSKVLDHSHQVPKYEKSAIGFDEYSDLRLVCCQPSVSRSSLFPVRGTHDASYIVEFCMSNLFLDANWHGRSADIVGKISEAFAPTRRPVHDQLGVPIPYITVVSR